MTRFKWDICHGTLEDKPYLLRDGLLHSKAKQLTAIKYQAAAKAKKEVIPATCNSVY